MGSENFISSVDKDKAAVSVGKRKMCRGYVCEGEVAYGAGI